MLNRIAEELRQGRKVVLVHGNADMDALGSAYALSKAFPEADVYAPNGLDRVTRMVSEKMDVAILEQCQQADGSVLLPEAIRPYFGADRLSPVR